MKTTENMDAAFVESNRWKAYQYDYDITLTAKRKKLLRDKKLLALEALSFVWWLLMDVLVVSWLLFAPAIGFWIFAIVFKFDGANTFIAVKQSFARAQYSDFYELIRQCTNFFIIAGSVATIFRFFSAPRTGPFSRALNNYMDIWKELNPWHATAIAGVELKKSE